jgi:hypothetical protein
VITGGFVWNYEFLDLFVLGKEGRGQKYGKLFIPLQ